MDKLINLTKRIVDLEKLRPEGLVQVNFEALKKEIKEMEVVIKQLRGKVNGSNTHVESLYTEVRPSRPYGGNITKL